MSRQWMQQAERSNRFTLRVMMWLARTMGRRTARLLLFPICFYYILSAPAARRSSVRYLQRVLERQPGFVQVFRHYHCFAATILDRVYLLSGRLDLLDIRLHGIETLRAYLRQGRGCLLFGAHLGSFDLMRALGREHKLCVRVLMFEQNAKKMGEVLRTLNPEADRLVIKVGAPDTLLRAKESLERGELVGILADRVFDDEKAVLCRFFGGSARFPAGPALLAASLKAPVFLFFGVYRGGSRYDVYYELLSEHVDIPRHSRDQGATYWMQKYAEHLERYCRDAPYNWFNFYDYWVDRPA